MTSRSNGTTALPTILIAGKPFVVITGFIAPIGTSVDDDPTLDPAYKLAARPASPILVEAVDDGLRIADRQSWLSWSACRRIGSSGGIKSLPLEFFKLVNEAGEVDGCANKDVVSEVPEVEAVSSHAKKPKTQKIKMALIRLDGGTQLRAGGLDEGAVDDYAEALARGEKLPPVILNYDGTHYWLVGGFHRVEAHKRAGKRVIEAEVHQGTLRDAVLLAVSENATHGLRRSNTDKRSAVFQLLNDTEWCKWTDHEIARRCGVSQPFVSKLRKEPQSDNGYHPAEGAESEKTVAPPGDSANYAPRGNGDFGDFDQDEAIEPEEGSQEDCNVDAVVAAKGTPTPVTEAQERGSESSVSPGKAETSVEEDAVYVAGAAEAAIAELPQVEVVTSDGASESEDEGEGNVEEEDTEEEEGGEQDEEEEEEDTEEEDEEESLDDLAESLTLEEAIELLRMVLAKSSRRLCEAAPEEVELLRNFADYVGVTFWMPSDSPDDDLASLVQLHQDMLDNLGEGLEDDYYD